ncbi:FadR/GntR family transcriptional regulator [Rhodococcus sp. NPDC055024]
MAPIEPVRQQVAHELALDQIRTALSLGRFDVGEALPRERDLAEMLQVSRVTVRTALAVLADAGVLEIRRGRGGGAFLTRPYLFNEADSESVLDSIERLRQVYEFRVAVESAAAAAAAKRRRESDIERLRRLTYEMDDLIDTSSKDSRVVAKHLALGTWHLALDHEFHIGVAIASQNDWFVDATRKARLNMLKPVGSVFTTVDTHANDLHKEIVDAIDARNSDVAGQIMTDHIRNSVERVGLLISDMGTFSTP